ncbi:MAG: hypothetical protein ACR2HS_00290 [Gammaproteobacteria bacterium]
MITIKNIIDAANALCEHVKKAKCNQQQSNLLVVQIEKIKNMLERAGNQLNEDDEDVGSTKDVLIELNAWIEKASNLVRQFSSDGWGNFNKLKNFISATKNQEKLNNLRRDLEEIKSSLIVELGLESLSEIRISQQEFFDAKQKDLDMFSSLKQELESFIEKTYRDSIGQYNELLSMVKDLETTIHEENDRAVITMQLLAPNAKATNLRNCTQTACRLAVVNLIKGMSLSELEHAYKSMQEQNRQAIEASSGVSYSVSAIAEGAVVSGDVENITQIGISAGEIRYTEKDVMREIDKQHVLETSVENISIVLRKLLISGNESEITPKQPEKGRRSPPKPHPN